MIDHDINPTATISDVMADIILPATARTPVLSYAIITWLAEDTKAAKAAGRQKEGAVALEQVILY